MAHHSKSCGSLLPFLKQQTLCGRLIDDEHLIYGRWLLDHQCTSQQVFQGRSGSSVEGLVEALDQSKSKRQGQSDLESEKEKKQVCAVRACSD
jgi:hypothetical protein